MIPKVTKIEATRWTTNKYHDLQKPLSPEWSERMLHLSLTNGLVCHGVAHSGRNHAKLVEIDNEPVRVLKEVRRSAMGSSMDKKRSSEGFVR